MAMHQPAKAIGEQLGTWGGKSLNLALALIKAMSEWDLQYI